MADEKIDRAKLEAHAAALGIRFYSTPSDKELYDAVHAQQRLADILAEATDFRDGFAHGSPAMPNNQERFAGVLDKPARIGGIVFRAGVKASTVIASAQRLYEYSSAAPPTGIAKAEEGPNIAFVADCLRNYAAVLESGTIDNAGHYFPSDIYDAAEQIEATPSPSSHVVGAEERTKKIRHAAKTLLTPDENGSRADVFAACENRVKVYKFDAVLHGLATATEGSEG